MPRRICLVTIDSARTVREFAHGPDLVGWRLLAVSCCALIIICLLPTALVSRAARPAGRRPHSSRPTNRSRPFPRRRRSTRSRQGWASGCSAIPACPTTIRAVARHATISASNGAQTKIDAMTLPSAAPSLPLNTLTVFNASLNFRFGWEGKIRSVEADVKGSLQNPDIMAGQHFRDRAKTGCRPGSAPRIRRGLRSRARRRHDCGCTRKLRANPGDAGQQIRSVARGRRERALGGGTGRLSTCSSLWAASPAIRA